MASFPVEPQLSESGKTTCQKHAGVIYVSFVVPFLVQQDDTEEKPTVETTRNGKTILVHQWDVKPISDTASTIFSTTLKITPTEFDEVFSTTVVFKNHKHTHHLQIGTGNQNKNNSSI